MTNFTPNSPTLESAGGGRIRRRRRSSVTLGRPSLVARSIAVLALAATLTGVVAVFPAPAGAAVAGWRMYDTNRDGYNESAVYFDAYGRSPRMYMDRNRDRRYDASIVTASGQVDYIWFDTNFNGMWDTLMDYNHLGQLIATLTNTWSEFDGTWDRLIANDGASVWTYQGSAHHRDTIYGLWWGNYTFNWNAWQGGTMTIGPSSHSSINVTLTRIIGVAAAMHPYIYG